MSRRNRVTITDIARRVGLTTITVSRALNKPELVKPATREKILTAANELGYVPNAFARHLKSSESRLIGLVTASVDNPFYSEVIKAISREAKKNNYTIMLIDTDGSPELETVAIETLLSYQVAGMILSPVSDDSQYQPAYLKRLLEKQLPVVMLDRTLDVEAFSRVVLDNRACGRMIGSYLAQTSVRRVLALSGPENSTITRQRLEGFIEAYASASVPLELDVIPGDYTLEPAYRGITDYLEQHPLPEAVFGLNQLITLGAMKGLQDAGVSRDQVKIVGIDRLPYSEIFGVAVPCVAHDTYRAGHDAIQLLFEKIANPASASREIVVPGVLTQ